MKTNSFKPLTKLTGWTLRLMGALIVVAVPTAVTPLFIDWNDPMYAESSAYMINAVGLLIWVLFWAVSGIVSLVWVYRATKNARILKPGAVTTTPAWAVGWFFIPFASLWKPYETLKEVWTASRGAGSRSVPLINLWWATYLIGNFIGWFVTRQTFSSDQAYIDMPFLVWVEGAGNISSLIATLCFYQMVRRIHRFQLERDTAAAEVF
ncbi:DUF4328 domain-containing protein [Asticcacaulis sp. YBE204]|uniref:DUF4328 domain-containing protein n=1 Tax=Asticcacaulis sp. YBE204 TaxID=1282363 RepID=UPI0003C3E032|nr:DUF4328 domain-containing protein [Asticcacaulis sp. YBE204]ESQ78993.1 hypothetical protein AEYBE204_11255 [Asticcacaulis sp. YBE204]